MVSLLIGPHSLEGRQKSNMGDKRSKTYLLYLGLLLIFFGYIHCNCTVTPIQRELTELGRVREYCIHNVTQNNVTVSIELLLDSKYETRDCMRCSCSRMGLTCCGIGYRGDSTIHVPKGCHAVVDGCRIALISNIDNHTDCYSIGPPAQRRRQERMMQGIVRQAITRENPQAMQYMGGPGGPPFSPFGPVGMMGPPRRGGNGGAREPPEGLMESILMMGLFGGSAGLMGGFGMGGMDQGIFGSPLGMGLLMSSMMS